MLLPLVKVDVGSVPDTPAIPAEFGSVDPADPLARTPWTSFQKWMVALVSVSTLVDGLDNLLLGTVIPSLMRQWHLQRSAFVGLVALSIVGMCAGTAAIGYLGDKFGRRPILIACVFAFGCATAASAAATDLTAFTACRVVAAVGLGGLFPSAVALVSDFTPLPRRNLAATIVQLCVPAGGMTGALLATAILPRQGWRELCAVGGGLGIALAILLLLTLHESPRYLLGRPGRRNALLQVLARCGIDPRRISAPGSAPGRIKTDDFVLHNGWIRLLATTYRNDSVALWAVLLCNYLVVYGMFNWGPALITAAGFTSSAMTLSFTMLNAGSIIGCLIGGWCMDRFGSRVPTLFCIALCIVVSAGLSWIDWPPLSNPSLMGGMFLLGAIFCGLQAMLYALASSVYPPAIRASGVGTAFGIGRLGAVGSALFGAGSISLNMPKFLGVAAVVMLAAAGALSILKRHSLPAEAAA